MTVPFRIKICGVTSAADAHAAIAAGADAIGLNFHRPSPRFLGREAAREVAAAAAGRVVRVGVFVNASADEVQRIAADLALEYVQIHGDEPPEYLNELAGLKVIRAFRCRDDGLQPAAEYCARCLAADQRPAGLAAVLIDSYSQTAYGGTGRAVDWNALTPLHGQMHSLPLILAGGLTAANVALAIATARPAAVDTASGVESSPGVKDADQMRTFVTEARQAFRGVSSAGR